MTSPIRRLGYSNNQLKAVNRLLKDNFRLPDSESMKLTFNPYNSLTGYYSSIAFDSVTSFFGIKVYVFCVLLENDNMDLRQILFQGLGQEKTLVYYNLH